SFLAGQPFSALRFLCFLPFISCVFLKAFKKTIKSAFSGRLPPELSLECRRLPKIRCSGVFALI
ncbi:hypothetical protein, partial [Cronobacter sakazakii]|uniref:hypothetical protein n=1 Tax=Cronobacter sakazakii TaxID=28141 RepID=UPI001C895FB3